MSEMEMVFGGVRTKRNGAAGGGRCLLNPVEGFEGMAEIIMGNGVGCVTVDGGAAQRLGFGPGAKFKHRAAKGPEDSGVFGLQGDRAMAGVKRMGTAAQIQQG